MPTSRCALVVKVNLAGVLVKNDILQHGAKADGLPDLGLARALEPDALGVAAALDVEHAAVRPAVLVVANQRPRRVCGQRGLARAWPDTDIELQTSSRIN